MSSLTALEAAAVMAAGVGAGTINTVVGSGTLITFPTLLAFGIPPVTANISNNIGLVPGGISGTWGYRRELAGQRDVLVRLAPVSVIGSLTGALLLLWLPENAFNSIVPVLIALALVLVVVQPRLARVVAQRRERAGAAADAGITTMGPGHRAALTGGVLGAGMYGGYFGAAQGVLLVGILGTLLPEPLQRVNATKNVLGTFVNGVAALVFATVAWAQIDWAVAGLIAAGSLIGGFIGAHVGRRLPPTVLRGVIVVVGLAAIVNLLAR